MNIDDAINRMSNCHPITKEDEEVFRCAVDCMKFTRDFFPLSATPKRMEQALLALNVFEHILNDEKIKEAFLFKIDEALANIKSIT